MTPTNSELLESGYVESPEQAVIPWHLSLIGRKPLTYSALPSKQSYLQLYPTRWPCCLCIGIIGEQISVRLVSQAAPCSGKLRPLCALNWIGDLMFFLSLRFVTVEWRVQIQVEKDRDNFSKRMGTQDDRA